jgi:hypothetical protein
MTQALKTTYTLQLTDDAGGWQEYSQNEYETEAQVHQLASQICGGIPRDEYRVIRVERHVLN